MQQDQKNDSAEPQAETGQDKPANGNTTEIVIEEENVQEQPSVAPTAPGVDRTLVEKAGLLVFVIAGACGVLFLFFTVLLVDNVEPWVRFRSVELFAMLAAIGIVVALIAKSADRFVSLLGIFIIGALIIPTKDMVYFTLLVTGGSLSEEIGGAAAEDGSEFQGRDSDLANKIVANLQETAKEEGARVVDPNHAIIGQLGSKERTRAVLSVTSTIAQDRITTHLERLRYSGALGLLLSFRPKDAAVGEQGSFREFYYRYGEEDEFLEDLRTLRAQELVTYGYTDVAEASITFLGKQVVCEYHAVFEASACPFDEVNRLTSRVQQRISRDPLDSVLRSPHPRQIALEECGNGFPNIQGEILGDAGIEVPFFAPFSIDEQDLGSVAIQLNDVEGVYDPYLIIITNSTSDQCEIVAFDDDGGREPLSARIETTLRRGNYVVAALNYGIQSEGVRMALTFEKE